MPALIAPLLAILLLSLAPGAAGASPSQEFDSTVAAFRAGDCPGAEKQATALLYPRPRIADPGELVRLHLILGECMLQGGQPLQAEREIEEALSIDPTLQDPGPLFSEAMTEVFRKKRDEMEREARSAEEKARIARELARTKSILENMVLLEKRRYWVNFVPFGAGQFQNGDTKKGIFFLSSQAVLGGLSVGLFGYQVIEYGFSGRVPISEVDNVNRIRVAQIASGFAFFALVGWGIADSLANYEHTVSRKPDPTILQELEEAGEAEPEPPPTSPSSSLKLFPAGGPDWAGVGLSWEF